MIEGENNYTTKAYIAWLICLLAAVFYSYDFFIRVAPSVMVHDLQKDLGLDPTLIGFLSAAYFYTYILFQIPAGIILDKFDSKIVIPAAMFICTLGNFLFSHTDGFWIAFIGRLLMGLGSAFGFIGAAKLAAMWLPKRLFSSFIGFATILGLLGGFVTDTILSGLVTKLGWRSGNDVFTYIGLAIFLVMLFFIRDNPEYRNKSLASTQRPFTEQLKQLLQIAKSGKFWAVSLVGGFLFVPINVLATLWGVGFIEYKFGISQSYASHINSLLFIGNIIGCIFVALVSPYTSRYRAMLVIACVSLLILSLLVIYVPMPLWVFIILFVLMGVSIGPELLVFDIGKNIAPPELTATSVAGVNVINNLVAAIMLPLIGAFLTYVSTHIIISHSSAHNLLDYKISFLIIPLSVFICIPLCFVLPKHISHKKI
jgi:MFS family permease